MGNKTFISHTVNIINRSHKGQRKRNLQSRKNSKKEGTIVFSLCVHGETNISN